MNQGNTSPQGGQTFGGGRGFRPPRASFGSAGFGASYGSSSGVGSWNDRSDDEGFVGFPRGFRGRRSAEETCNQGFRGGSGWTEEDWNDSGDFRGGPALTDGTWNVSRGFSRGFGEDRNGSGGFSRGFVGGSGEDRNGSGGFSRGFVGGSEEDRNGSGGFSRGFRGGAQLTKEDWGSSGGVPRRNDGGFGWHHENSCDANRGSSNENRNFISYTRGSGYGRQEAAFLGGRRLSGGVKKRGKFPTALAAKKGFKNCPRDANYAFLKQYVYRIDRTLQRGRKGIISTTSSSTDKKLMNDLVYYLAQAEQEMRVRLAATRGTGCTGKCNFCGQNNGENRPMSNGIGVASVSVNSVANISVNEDEEW